MVFIINFQFQVHLTWLSVSQMAQSQSIKGTHSRNASSWISLLLPERRQERNPFSKNAKGMGTQVWKCVPFCIPWHFLDFSRYLSECKNSLLFQRHYFWWLNAKCEEFILVIAISRKIWTQGNGADSHQLKPRGTRDFGIRFLQKKTFKWDKA